MVNGPEARVRLALPKGRLEPALSPLVRPLGLPASEAEAGLLRLRSTRFPGLSGRILHERDIPIQVAVGHYDLGICGSEWVEEVLCRYPSDALVVLGALPFGRRHLYAAISDRGGADTWPQLLAQQGSTGLRLASEFSNLTEAFALQQRLQRFRIFPLWGAPEAYPPEDADVVLLPVAGPEALAAQGLRSVATVLEGSACLVAHRGSLERKDLSEVLEPLWRAIRSLQGRAFSATEVTEADGSPLTSGPSLDGSSPAALRLALPDGHQQPHAMKLLEAMGVTFPGYSLPLRTRRPSSPEPEVRVKVIRPQDMALQVANGHFDLAITGQDWLREHQTQFPDTPAVELADLGFARVRIVAVVAGDLLIEKAQDLQGRARWGNPLRIASEYPHLADHYARSRHLSPYKVIPTWGATEGFLPEDADLLIENTETGGSIARHGLRILEELFVSRGCLIGYKPSLQDPVKAPLLERWSRRLQAAARASVSA